MKRRLSGAGEKINFIVEAFANKLLGFDFIELDVPEHEHVKDFLIGPLDGQKVGVENPKQVELDLVVEGQAEQVALVLYDELRGAGSD